MHLVRSASAPLSASRPPLESTGDRALPEVPSAGVRRGRRPGGGRADAPERDRARPGAAGVPLRRAARDGQDVARAHPREGAQLRGAGRRRRPTTRAPSASRSRTAARSTWSRWTRPRSAGSTTSARSASASCSSRSRAATKVYILDEAHQLTDAAWNALLKLIEEPPPHLVFVFCTTELQKVLATVRSRCQTFVFERPRLPDLVREPAPDRRRRGDPGARRGARAHRPRRPRRLPRRRVDTRPARVGDGQHDRRPVRAAARRGGRGRGAVAPVRHGRRRGHGRRAAVRRGAVRAGAGPRPACHRPARASPAPAAGPAHGPRTRLAARYRGDERALARTGESASRADRRCV